LDFNFGGCFNRFAHLSTENLSRAVAPASQKRAPQFGSRRWQCDSDFSILLQAFFRSVARTELNPSVLLTYAALSASPNYHLLCGLIGLLGLIRYGAGHHRINISLK
jgi:hypothetical protein